MNTFFTWLVKKVLVEFLYEKLILFIKQLIGLAEETKERKKIIVDNDTQAALVESIAAEIKALLKEGKEVPEELYERLKVESRKLSYRSDL